MWASGAAAAGPPWAAFGDQAAAPPPYFEAAGGSAGPWYGNMSPVVKEHLRYEQLVGQVRRTPQAMRMPTAGTAQGWGLPPGL
jgi:hypothetical protein